MHEEPQTKEYSNKKLIKFSFEQCIVFIVSILNFCFISISKSEQMTLKTGSSAHHTTTLNFILNFDYLRSKTAARCPTEMLNNYRIAGIMRCSFSTIKLGVNANPTIEPTTVQ